MRLEQEVAEAVQRHHERVEHVLGPQHRRRDPAGEPLGLLQRQRLRHHLADDDVEVGEDGDGDDAGDAVRGEPRRHAGAAERAVDRLGEDVLAIHAEAKTGERDAELRGRDVAILELRIAEDALNTLRQAVALRGARLDGRARRADDRELRGDEDARSAG